jgi:hypothetical protein
LAPLGPRCSRGAATREVVSVQAHPKASEGLMVPLADIRLVIPP